MESDLDKVMGCFLGMAVGDAMGRSVNGLKPKAISQIFGVIEDYQDVKYLVGKGIKRYCMKGLYGAPTQCALAVCDGVLTNKKKFLEETSKNFQNLSKGSSENYFGVFRSSESCLWKSVDLLDVQPIAEPTPQSSATAFFTSLSVPLVLFHKKWSKTLSKQCLDMALMFSNHPQEVVGTVLNGFLITRFLTLQEDELISQGKVILQEAAEVCIQAERGYRDRVNVFEDESIANTSNAFSQTLEGLILQLEKTEKDALQWITDNASVYTNREIRHPSQGFVLTLIPLALHWLLTHEKKNFISSILTHGRETQKLGALTGSWIGAIYGAQVIPEKLKTGLVNSREIRLRGESLFHRRMKKNIKPLVDMETALTAKEIDETKRYQRNEIKKVLKTIAIDFMDVEEDIVPTKEDRAQWRKLQKEKTRNKRDRRKNIPDVIV